jgi:hypothetical protein
MNPIAIAFLLILVIVLFLIWRNSRGADGLDPRLVEAARGNTAMAKRMLEQARIKYPGKSDRWYVEKVTYDMERDYGVIKSKRSRFRFNQRELREKLLILGSVLWIFRSLVATFDRLFRR